MPPAPFRGADENGQQQHPGERDLRGRGPADPRAAPEAADRHRLTVAVAPDSLALISVAVSLPGTAGQAVHDRRPPDHLSAGAGHCPTGLRLVDMGLRLVDITGLASSIDREAWRNH